MHILGPKFISISLGLSQKKEIEKWLLRTLVQCILRLGLTFDTLNALAILQICLGASEPSPQAQIQKILSGEGGSDNQRISQEGRTDLNRETIDTSISKETYSLVIFQWGRRFRPLPLPHLDPTMHLLNIL